MRRNKILDDFRSNVSQGAETQKIKLTEIEQEACLRAAKAVNGEWVGVDFIPAKNRDKDEPFILEINHSPGTQGISDLLKEEVSEIVIEDYYDRDTWRKSAMECGVLETIEVEGDIMTAKLDTGNNTSACAIHTEDLTINGKVATWKTNGKKYKKPIIRYAELIKPAEKRPVVKLEINFLNTIYDQEVFLDSRGKIPFLANRDFMKRANVMINPSRKFLLTNKHDDGHDD